MTGTRRLRIGIDTGGTFTDVVLADAGRLTYFKVPSTPDDPSRAILEGISRAHGGSSAPSSELEVVHGTTVATNALLERKGARTALVTNAGFEDILVTGRQARPELYNLAVRLPAAVVPRELCFGVGGRIGPGGDEVEPATDADIDALVRAVAACGAKSVAVSLLFSFANPSHERLVAERLRATGLPVSVSHEILPEYREYERTATVAVNAYLEPRMRAYLGRLQDAARRLHVVQLRVMQSSGGSISARSAAAQPVRTILSGPAGGVVAARQLSERAGLGDLVTFDMGGTSTDVALVANAAAETTNEARVAGLPVAVPMIDIHTVGAGGGSIARVDAGGALRVGPESAGADPGPACYGRGELPTVTDANVVLGRLGSLLGGSMTLDRERAATAIATLARDIERASGRTCTAEDAALGVVRVASVSMERALRVVSIERGYDPRRASLLCFGGAGGLHACDLAGALGMRSVVVPPFPGAFSAVGLLLGDVVRDVTATVIGGGARHDEVLERLERDALEQLGAEGFEPADVVLERQAALRYRGQSFSINLAWRPGCEDDFHEAHRVRYGHADTTRDVETVSLSVRARGRVEPIGLPASPSVAETTPRQSAMVRFADDWRETAVYDRDRLGAGCRIDGPAVIEEYGSVTIVPFGWRLEVNEHQCLVLTKDG